jgi:hypothetical protein
MHKYSDYLHFHADYDVKIQTARDIAAARGEGGTVCLYESPGLVRTKESHYAQSQSVLMIGRTGGTTFEEIPV